MNGWSALDRFLQTDPRDVGCAEAMDLLHVYAELTAGRGTLPGHRRSPAGLRSVRRGLRRATGRYARRRGLLRWCRRGWSAIGNPA